MHLISPLLEQPHHFIFVTTALHSGKLSCGAAQAQVTCLIVLYMMPVQILHKRVIVGMWME